MMRFGGAICSAAALSSSSSSSSCLRATLSAETEEAMLAFGAALGIVAEAGNTVCLSGDLGVGKSVFARGFIRSRVGNSRLRVTSPTYLLDNAYEADDGLAIHHLDLYRLVSDGDETALYMLDLPNALRDATCLVEWPGRLEKFLSEPRLDVVISELGSKQRRVNLEARSLDRDNPMLDVLRALQ